jgi:NADH dehydrogenase
MMPSNKKKSIAILGGSGFIGKNLVGFLAKQNAYINVLTTNKINTRTLWTIPNVKIFQYQNNVESIKKAIENTELVINLVGILHSKPGNPWGKEFDDAHVKLLKNLVDASNKEKIKKIIHISALGVSKSAPSEYLRSKYAGECILQSFSGQIYLLRPSVVFGSGDSFLNLFAKLQRYSPIMPLAYTKAKFQPIYVQDLIEIIWYCIQRNDGHKETIFECVGPEVFTLYEIVKFAGIYSGYKAMVIPLPKFLGWLQAFTLEKIPGETLMSRDNLRSLTVPSVASEEKNLVFNLTNPTSIHKVAPKFLKKK